jgi:uncharacterized protein
MNKKLTAVLANYFKNKPVKKVYLFGSKARGAGSDSSDIDLLVELDHTTPIGLKFVTMKIELEHLLHADVDLVTTESVSKYLRPFIDQEKLLIYEKFN